MTGTVEKTWADERPRLIGLAYRLTGSRVEAEDLVQEAFTRLSLADAVDNPPAWLTTVTTRLALDHLRLARVQRETYIGPWVPEPVAEDFGDPQEDVEMAESVSLALMVVMESMSPVERATFVLHDVFGYTHAEVGDMLDRSPAAIRQAAARGRKHLESRRPRFEPDPSRRIAVGQRFMAAVEGDDIDAFMALLSPDVVFRSDGGGVVTAARRVLEGRDRVARFLLALRDGAEGVEVKLREVNAGPALWLTAADGTLISVIAMHVGPDGSIAEFNAVLNPDKIRHLARGSRGGG